MHSMHAQLVQRINAYVVCTHLVKMQQKSMCSLYIVTYAMYLHIHAWLLYRINESYIIYTYLVNVQNKSVCNLCIVTYAVYLHVHAQLYRINESICNLCIVTYALWTGSGVLRPSQRDSLAYGFSRPPRGRAWAT